MFSIFACIVLSIKVPVHKRGSKCTSMHEIWFLKYNEKKQQHWESHESEVVSWYLMRMYIIWEIWKAFYNILLYSCDYWLIWWKIRLTKLHLFDDIKQYQSWNNIKEALQGNNVPGAQQPLYHQLHGRILQIG